MNKLSRAVVYMDHGAMVGSWDPDSGGCDEDRNMHLVPGDVALTTYVEETKARAIYDAVVKAFVTPVCTAPELRWDTVRIISSGEAQVWAERLALRVVRHGPQDA